VKIEVKAERSVEVAPVAAAPVSTKNPEKEPPRLGVSVGDIKGVKGVRVTSIVPGSFADLVDIQVNDVITSLNNQLISDARKFTEKSQDLQWGDAVALVFKRGSKENIVKIELTEEALLAPKRLLPRSPTQNKIMQTQTDSTEKPAESASPPVSLGDISPPRASAASAASPPASMALKAASLDGDSEDYEQQDYKPLSRKSSVEPAKSTSPPARVNTTTLNMMDVSKPAGTKLPQTEKTENKASWLETAESPAATSASFNSPSSASASSSRKADVDLEDLLASSSTGTFAGGGSDDLKARLREQQAASATASPTGTSPTGTSPLARTKTASLLDSQADTSPLARQTTGLGRPKTQARTESSANLAPGLGRPRTSARTLLP